MPKHEDIYKQDKKLIYIHTQLSLSKYINTSMASTLNNKNNKDDERKGGDITNNNAEVVDFEPTTIVQKMSKINFVIDILPSGGAGRNIVCAILSMLDMKSLSSLIYSSFIQLFCKNRNDDTLYQMCKIIQYPYLNKKYIKEFGSNSSSLVCACEYGRLADVKSLITGYDGSGSNDNTMTLNEYVNQETGERSDREQWSPLKVAVRFEHFQVVQYLIEQGEADPNIADIDCGWNALHYAAAFNKTNNDIICLLLTHMAIGSINKMTFENEFTPLDCALNYGSPIQHIIDFICSKGGKRHSELLNDDDWGDDLDIS